MQRAQGCGIHWEVGLRRMCEGTGWMRVCWKAVPARQPRPSHTIPSSRPPRSWGVRARHGSAPRGPRRRRLGLCWTYHFHFLAIMTSVAGQGNRAEAPAANCETEVLALHSPPPALQQQSHVNVRHGRSFPAIVWCSRCHHRGEISDQVIPARFAFVNSTTFF